MQIHQPQLQQPLLVIVHCCVKDCVLTSATPGTPNVAKVAVRLGKSSCSTFWEVEGQDAKTESDIGFTTLSTKCAPPGVFICHFILEPLASGGGQLVSLLASNRRWVAVVNTWVPVVPWGQHRRCATKR